MTYNELKTAVNLLNAECEAGIKHVGVKSDDLEAEFIEASRYFAGEAEKNGMALSEELQGWFRDITGDELHAAAVPGPDPGVTPATALAHGPTQAPITRTVATATAPSATAPSAVAANVPIPEGAARRRASARYPFADMDVKHSFFVPCTKGRPDPAKSMQSTVSSAVRKFSVEDPSGATRVNRNGKTVPVMNPTKTFICRAVEDGAPWNFPGVAGAGIWRTT